MRRDHLLVGLIAIAALTAALAAESPALGAEAADLADDPIAALLATPPAPAAPQTPDAISLLLASAEDVTPHTHPAAGRSVDAQGALGILMADAQDRRPTLSAPVAPVAPPAADALSHQAYAALDTRRRPGRAETFEPPVIQANPGAAQAPAPDAFPVDQIPVPDRWRLAEAIGVHSRWFDPYNQNTLKGDRPIKGTRDWFLALTGVSDTLIEPRSFPIPVGAQTTQRAGSLDTFGRTTSLAMSQTVLVGASLIKGSTAFKPPQIELRASLAFNHNYVEVPEKRVLSIRPTAPTHRNDNFIGVQEAFLDYHLRNVSDRYDFDSVRVGVQPFATDFRGFLFQDNQLGVRFFGDRDNNRWQYNLAVFRRIEKDSNSGLNDLGQPLRHDWIFAANLYRQDLPWPGMTSQVTVVYNRNRERHGVQFDKNGFPVRPALIGDDRARDYDVTYLGYNADGHIGRLNLTASAYAALGEDRNSIFTSRKTQIRSFFLAAEPSYDFAWIRIRGSALYASGDKDPYDNKETGFDAIQENPQFAGADTSYWIRQSIPFAGGGRGVGLNGRNGVLNSLRSTKDEGQSNFNNPGTVLLGAGGDFDVTPKLRLSANVNHLWFADTAVLRVLRHEGSIPDDLGWDYSVSSVWRPQVTQNLVFRASAAVFQPGDGFADLFSSYNRDSRYYSVLLNAILSF